VGEVRGALGLDFGFDVVGQYLAKFHAHWSNESIPQMTPLRDLAANFSDPRAQGPTSYAEQFVIDHPEENASTLAADALIAVETSCRALLRN
jgi:hypothetical protein